MASCNLVLLRWPCLFAKPNGDSVSAKNPVDNPNAFFRSRHGSPHIRAGKVRVMQLSERRIGIGEDDNADFQARCAGAAGDPWRARRQEGLRTIERFADLPVSRIEN
jgi:hypothetical protein